MRTIFLILCLLPAYFIIYKLVPLVHIRLNKSLLVIKDSLALTFEPDKPAANCYWQKFKDKCEQAGLLGKRSSLLLVGGYLLLPALTTIYLLNRGLTRVWPLFLLLEISLMNSYINKRIKKRQQVFNSLLYKIYRFLHMQLEAGLLPADLLANIGEAVDHPSINGLLQKMSAAWLLTGDLDLAIAELKGAFGPEGTQLLANNLRQCLVTGIAGKTFQQMENLLFARYLDYVKAKSEQMKNYILAALICFMLPVMIVLLWPIFCDTMAALNSIFYS